MAVFDSCDDAALWIISAGVKSVDTTIFVTAPGSIKVDIPAGPWNVYLDRYVPLAQDRSATPIWSFWVRVSDPTKMLRATIWYETATGLVSVHYLLTGLLAETWQQITLDLRNPGAEGVIPDLTKFRGFGLVYTLQSTAGVLRVDQIEATSAVLPKGFLEIHATINGVEANLSGSIIETGTTFTLSLIHISEPTRPY